MPPARARWVRAIPPRSAGIDAALYAGAKCYFFEGSQYISVTRGEMGPGTPDPGYPQPIAGLDWNGFGADGIDAALYSGTKCYIFKGAEYIRVTRSDTSPGSIDAGYPQSISEWGWPDGFGAGGIAAALYSGSKCYFFDGQEYIRVSRGDTGGGLTDPGYPKPISNWDWPSFGADGISAALYSGGPLAPAGQLSSSLNYVLSAGGSEITGLACTIDIDETLVSSSGWSFQLNCYSAGNPVSWWQQFLILGNGTELSYQIEGYQPLSPAPGGGTWHLFLYSSTIAFATLPSASLEAGSRLTITVLYEQGSTAISGASFAVFDPQGQPYPPVLISSAPPLPPPGNPASASIIGLKDAQGQVDTTAQFAPIVNCTMNLVGPPGGTAAFTAGSGTFTITADQALTPTAPSPETGETGNSVYAPMPSLADTTLYQGFSTSAS
jgi:hypothetical protein